MKERAKKLTALILSIMVICTGNSFAFAETELPDVQNKPLENCIVDEIEAVSFDGKEQKPKVNLTDGEYVLIEGVDYHVAYLDNVNAGTAKVTLTGMGAYTGAIATTFCILKGDITIKGSNVASTGKPKVTWKNVKGAVKYEVRRATKKNGTYQFLIKTDKTSHVNKNAERGKTYYYKVIAIDKHGKKVNFNQSNIVTMTCKLPNPKVKASNVAATGKPKISWAKIKGAEKYAVYRGLTKNGTYTYLLTTKKNSMINTSAKAGRKYYYKVKAIDLDNRKADSALSDIVVRSCDLKKPIVSITLNENAKPKLTWKKISGAEKYEIFRSQKKNGTYRSIGKASGTVYTDKKAKGGKTYYYKVRAIDSDNSGANSAKSSVRSIYAVDLSKKLVALTFDDGPGPYTKAIVNALKKHNSRATFFVLGQRVKSYPDELKAIFSGGNEIGNHSYSHPILSEVSSKEIKSQMSRTDNAVKKIIGIKPALMRPPGGGVDKTVQDSVGKPIIYWSIDTLDWKTRSKTETVKCVMNEVSDGDIVLMHDIHEPTKEAALELIPKLKKKGYELVTVSEMAKFKGKKLKNGVVYYSF